ncbi:uncharacterized protein LOC107263326 [Cephus cinctus]|uniref:Uncharacterized protein LOC107263326 n=1 Tax=Cephus cinctus TaxID=211228 RepID=A0AAJ7BH73_CEPCN|nr:uncharacterized protein LOC107263326 [Cephus cinctus]
MYGRPDNSGTTPPWLVRAEVTIRHGTPVTSPSSNVTEGSASTVTDPNGVRMVYRWTPGQQVPQASSSSTSSTSSGFGFQRGNILFTSTPPARTLSTRSFTIPRTGVASNIESPGFRANVSDSGYNSEQFSPQSSTTFPSRRPSQQYNRRCRSTCSIVLSTVGAQNNPKPYVPANTSQSFRQQPDFRGGKVSCSDPWCYHAAHQHVSARCQFSTVPEGCEDCAEGIASGSNAFTTHFCTRVPEKMANKATVVSRDAASQTTDIESQGSQSSLPRTSKVYSARRKTPPGSLAADEQKKIQQINQLSCPPSATRSSASSAELDKSDSSEKDDNSKRKSRTVHIDVYCTGSDDDLDESSDSDSSSNEEDKAALPVFECDDVRVIHTRAKSNVLPRGLQDDKAFLKRSAERRCESFKNAPMRMPSLASSKGYESDDVLSSLYPSQFSSYSALRDLDSNAWSAASSSVGIPFEGYDSTAATSCKDTFSDIESLINSRTSLTPCDSFEYANSSDRERIDKMENLWAQKDGMSKTWKSPHIERRHLLQNKKMKEYLEKHQIGWSSGESAAESDDSAEVGWSFVSSDENTRVVKRDSTIRRTSKDKIAETESANLPSDAVKQSSEVTSKEQVDCVSQSDSSAHPFVLRDQIGPFGSRNSTPPPSKVESRVTSPFTTPQGEKTEHIIKASIFGMVVTAFRKPGHHIGPSKNPSCSCEHCRRFFDEEGPRGRSRSLSELERRPGFWYRRGRDIISPATTTSLNN